MKRPPLPAWTSRSAPFPLTPAYLRELLEAGGITQLAAAAALHVDPSTFRRWLMDPEAASASSPPWAAGELLRRMVVAGELATPASRPLPS